MFQNSSLLFAKDELAQHSVSKGFNTFAAHLAFVLGAGIRCWFNALLAAAFINE